LTGWTKSNKISGEFPLPLRRHFTSVALNLAPPVSP
jgi:hypothetical protein